MNLRHFKDLQTPCSLLYLQRFSSLSTAPPQWYAGPHGAGCCVCWFAAASCLLLWTRKRRERITAFHRYHNTYSFVGFHHFKVCFSLRTLGHIQMTLLFCECPCVVLTERAVETWLCLKVWLFTHTHTNIPTHTLSFHSPFFLLGTLKRERHHFHLCVHLCVCFQFPAVLLW